MSNQMTADTLSGLAGIALSLIAAYAPGVKEKYDGLSPVWKRLVMLGLLALAAIAAFGLSCGNVVASVTCDKEGAVGLVQSFIMALISNQSAYQMIRRTPAAE